MFLSSVSIHEFRSLRALAQELVGRQLACERAGEPSGTATRREGRAPDKRGQPLVFSEGLRGLDFLIILCCRADGGSRNKEANCSETQYQLFPLNSFVRTKSWHQSTGGSAGISRATFCGTFHRTECVVLAFARLEVELRRCVTVLRETSSPAESS